MKMVFDEKSKAILLENMKSFDLDHELQYLKYVSIFIHGVSSAG